MVFVTHNVWQAVYLSSRVVVMGARPGRVVDDIAIDGPAHRDNAFRLSPAYAHICNRVSAALKDTLASTSVDH